MCVCVSVVCVRARSSGHKNKIHFCSYLKYEKNM